LDLVFVSFVWAPAALHANTRLERIASDKHSGLLQKLVNYRQMEFYKSFKIIKIQHYRTSVYKLLQMFAFLLVNFSLSWKDIIHCNLA